MMYLCKGFNTLEVGDNHIWVLRFAHPFVTALYRRSTRVEALSRFKRQPVASYSAYIEVKFCSYNPSSN